MVTEQILSLLHCWFISIRYGETQSLLSMALLILIIVYDDEWFIYTNLTTVSNLSIYEKIYIKMLYGYKIVIKHYEWEYEYSFIYYIYILKWCIIVIKIHIK